MITDDRSCYQLRKEGYIGAQPDEVGLSLHLAAIDIRQIRDALEGIKGDAYGKEDSLQEDRRDAKDTGQHIDIINQEVGIFEKDERREV